MRATRAEIASRCVDEHWSRNALCRWRRIVDAEHSGKVVVDSGEGCCCVVSHNVLRGSCDGGGTADAVRIRGRE